MAQSSSGSTLAGIGTRGAFGESYAARHGAHAGLTVAGEGEPRCRIGGCGWIRSRDAGLGAAGGYEAAARVWRGGSESLHNDSKI
jgi:hypothetical protein